MRNKRIEYCCCVVSLNISILIFLYKNPENSKFLTTIKMKWSDFLGDTYAVLPLFTKEANAEAIAKMNPRVTRSMWVSPSNANHISYALSLDSAATIYTCTKE